MEWTPALGVIGGTGLYGIEGLEQIETRELETPFGAPSSPVVLGVLEGRQVAFLARHGLGHHIMPSEVNYRANLYALKALGVRRVLSVSACGSLREDYAPGDVVIPDQLFDHTLNRRRSFFGRGLVGHVSVADPFCADLSARLAQAVAAAGGTLHRGGTSITIEGPRFSTRAESNTYRAWGMAIIGMTTAPEAFLAREAEMCYTTMSHITDYDVWHESEEPVTVDMVVETMHRNLATAQQALAYVIERLDEDADCACHHALDNAIMTDPRAMPAEVRARLQSIAGRHLTER